MAKNKMKAPKDAVERNLALTGQVMQYILEQPHVLDSLPDDFVLVTLPEDDPEISRYNIELLETFGKGGKPIVFARLKSSRASLVEQEPPSLYIPLAA